MSLELLFQNASGGAGTNGTPYEKAVFKDVTLLPDSNAGLTDTALTNPTAAKVGNADSPTYQAKTLLIKDIVLIEDRSQWINEQPTYEIIFKDTLMAVRGYIFGAFGIGKCSDLAPGNGTDSPLTKQRFIQFTSVGSGIGITGRIRRLQWLVQGDTVASATAMRSTDGVDTTAIDFSGQAVDASSNNTAKFDAYVHEAANETNDLHDFQLKAQQVGTLKVLGVVAYFENAGGNLDLLPGRTFVNKQLVETTQGATFALPAFGSSLGGAVAFQASPLGATIPIQDANPILMQGIGNSGTNLVDVTTGQGGSFLVGHAFVAPQGSSQYVGAVRQVSTDTLTVFPTLPFGVSAMVYSSWLSGPTYAISPTLFARTTSIGVTNMLGLTNPILDPAGRHAIWGANVGMTTGITTTFGYMFMGASGFLQIEGYFQAADINLLGAGQRWHATISINGIPMYSENVGVTASLRRTLFTDGGNGWNSIVIGAGASMGQVEISQINLYTRAAPIGASFGVLALMQVNQAEVVRSAQNATLIALGMQRRVFADQLQLTGAWSRVYDPASPAGVAFNGTSTNAALDFQYYGQDLAIIGSTFTAGSTLVIDGLGVPLTPNVVITRPTLGFHTMRLTVGVSSQIGAIDFFRPVDEIQNKQIYHAAPVGQSRRFAQWKKFIYSTPGTYTMMVPMNGSTLSFLSLLGCGGGGGGGGGGSAGGGASGGGGGGGSPFSTEVLALQPGQKITIVVGAAGGGGAVLGSGTPGGDTYIANAAGTRLITWTGGNAGAPGSGSGGASGGAGGAAKANGGAGGEGGQQSSSSGLNYGRAGTKYSLYRGVEGPHTNGSGFGFGDGGGGGASIGDGGMGGQVAISAQPVAGQKGAGGGGGFGSNAGSGEGALGGAGYLELSIMLGEYEE